MKIYNSLSKEKEDFTPIKTTEVSMYHCGPTVYDHVHIGNLRSFLLGDFVRRSFEYLGYQTKQVMNITDVGHLVSDGDEGNDKMTKALKKHDKEITLENMLEIADVYKQSFEKDLEKLNILIPHYLPKASDHIPEDIEIIKKLEEKDYTYKTSDGVYFDTSKMADYGKLGGLNLEGDTENRIQTNEEKRNNADFALWKFDDKNGWGSPWGQGFPGWHIECSGMSMKYLGAQFDIHTGGSDLRSVHHNNEIAQSECATGNAPFVQYWMHGEMLNFGGAKLSKSTGGNITLKTLEEKNIKPLAYRYLALQTHYRSQMNFTWEILESAENGYKRILREIVDLRKEANNKGKINRNFKATFTEKIKDDINLPQALSIFHEVLKSSLSPEDKLATLYDFDQVLGLELETYEQEKIDIPNNIQKLLIQRKQARLEKNWDESDRIRDLILEKGFKVKDNGIEQILERKI